MSRNQLWSVLVVFVDLLMFYFSFRLAYAVSVLIYGPRILPMSIYLNLLLFANFTLAVILGFSGLYRRKRSLFDSEDFYLLRSLLNIVLMKIRVLQDSRENSI